MLERGEMSVGHLPAGKIITSFAGLRAHEEGNDFVIGEAEDVFSGEFLAGKINYMGISGFKDGARFRTKIRYAHKGAAAALYKESGGAVRFVFDEPQRAVTPGQAVVFYDGNCVAGGGIIL